MIKLNGIFLLFMKVIYKRENTLSIKDLSD